MKILKILLPSFFFIHPLCLTAGPLTEDYFVKVGQQYTKVTQECARGLNDPKIINRDELVDKYYSNELNIFDDVESRKFASIMRCIRLNTIVDIYKIYTRKNTMQAFDKYTMFPPGARELILEYMGTYSDVIKKYIDLNDENDRLFFQKIITAKEHDEKFQKITKETMSGVSKDYSEMISQVQDALKGKPPRSGKTEKNRELARNDVVAQVLNYASGVPEDASGDTFYYPVDTEGGRCVYKMSINEKNPTMKDLNGLAEASQFAESLGVQGLSGINSAIKNGIDLNKYDLQQMTFYKRQGTQRNKYTGVTAQLSYISKIDGLPDLFECDSTSCNIERLKRGWALVQSKCKGVRKAF